MEIAIDGLRFSRDRRPILDIPSLRMASGAVTAVFGPNGGGKTTLLRLLAGLERPDAGAMHIGSRNVAERPVAPGPVAFGFQEPVFLRGTVRRNLALALRLRRVPPAEAAERIGAVAAECGIEALLDRPARELSGGEMRRAALARVLALQAPVTLLDEPLAGIDRIARTHLLDDLPRLLARFASTTVLVTHDREEAFRLADDLVILAGGTVLAAGPKASVHAAPPDAATAELLGYTVLYPPDGPIAVPQGGLRFGDGARAFDFRVERVVDMGNHLHLLGAIGGQRADLRLSAGMSLPVAGTRIRVCAPDYVELPRRRSDLSPATVPG